MGRKQSKLEEAIRQGHSPLITAYPFPQSERFELFAQLSHDAAARAKGPAHDAALSDCELSVHDCSVHDVFDLVERRRSSGKVVERLRAPDADYAPGLGLRFGFGFGLGLGFRVPTMLGAVVAVFSRQVSTLAFLPRYGHWVVLAAAGNSVFDTRGEVTEFIFNLLSSHRHFLSSGAALVGRVFSVSAHEMGILNFKELSSSQFSIVKEKTNYGATN
jgi:hypothetical protein